MSKIIKARFVMIDNSLNKSMTQAVTQQFDLDIAEEQSSLTLKTAEEIYSETKTMMEEIVSEAQSEAENILLLAKAEAHKILEDAKTKVDELKKKAAKDGYEQGVIQGTQESKKNTSKIMEQTVKLLEKIEKDRVELYKKYDEIILDLTFLLARKILGNALDIRPEIISGILENVLKEVKDTEHVIIKVNPVHLPYLGIDSVRFSEIQGSIKFIEDTSLNPGDCILLTETGFLEYKIDEQFKILRTALLDVTNDA